MCDNFIPLVKKGGRIVNVASVGGHLNGYSAEAKKRIQSGASSTSALKDLVSEYEVRNTRNELICRWSADSRGEQTGSRGRIQEGRVLRQQSIRRRFDKGFGRWEYWSSDQLVSVIELVIEAITDV
jgi:NAD(P)-dependent dehydrogenase (short-subunit alcohol dehydrogenase family)